jgi:hypothetical protein
MLIKSHVDMVTLDWFDFDEPMKSNATKIELYLSDIISGNLQIVLLKKVFFEIFAGKLDSIYITQEKINADWGGLPLDVWVLQDNEFIFDNSGEISDISRDYLSYLDQSHVEYDYQGVCKCNDWQRFLNIIIPGVLNQIFIYSPKILDVENNMILYFHHSGSIGIYFNKRFTLPYIRNIASRYNLSLQVIDL